MTFVKICGITRKEDALFAASRGADAIGIVHARESERFTEIEKAEEIFRMLPLFISRVMVASPKDVVEVVEMERIHVDCLQLHGNESVEFIREIRESSNLLIIKQVPVTGEESIEEAVTYSELVDAILLDTKVKGRMGGTGKTHDWDISRKIVDSIENPVILAGGLNPDNVARAVKEVRPYAVDVASGVETAPGVKDYDKLKEFIQNATR